MCFIQVCVYKSWSILGLALASINLLGCGKVQLETVPVHGKITIDGKPLETGRVRFFPERGRVAAGDLQSDGIYTLTTYADGDGAVLGNHRVSVEARTAAQQVSIESDDVPGNFLIPARYADEAKSGLTFEVKSGEDNQANFDLRSQ